MHSLTDSIAHGNPWLFIPGAVLLGILHGLEPGHSKTMMTAFIVAIRGTVKQAVLLGLSATVSHTAIIWILAFIGLRYSSSLNVEGLEPYFQLATGVIVMGLGLWIFYRTRQTPIAIHHHTHHHDHDHAHEEHGHHHDDILEFADDHEREHALELEKSLANKQVTTPQVIVFGLTGGLLPCPSAFAVLLLCLQLKKLVLGFAIVLAFSLGLAITFMTVGIIAAISVKHVSKKFNGLGEWARKAPFVSSSIMMVIGLLVAAGALWHLMMK